MFFPLLRRIAMSGVINLQNYIDRCFEYCIYCRILDTYRKLESHTECTNKILELKTKNYIDKAYTGPMPMPVDKQAYKRFMEVNRAIKLNVYTPMDESVKCPITSIYIGRMMQTWSSTCSSSRLVA